MDGIVALTLAKSYASSLVGVGATVTVVSALPTTGQAKVIYLVEHSASEDVYYDQYVYATNQWVSLGRVGERFVTAYTKNETDLLLADKVDTVQYATDMAGKANASALTAESTARSNGDTALQNQIDAIVSKSDVVDVVATYADLEDYDTSGLFENDVVKVMTDSTHSNAISYYKWADEQWNYVGSQGPFYTKGETDTLLSGKVSTATVDTEVWTLTLSDGTTLTKTVMLHVD